MSTENEVTAMRSVLGAMILDVNAAAIGLSALRPDAMIGGLAIVLGAMRKMYERSIPIDSLTLCAALEGSGDLERAGGPVVISHLLEYAGALVNIEQRCEIVNNEAVARALRKGCLETLRDLEPGGCAAPEALDEAEARILAIRDSHQKLEMESLGVVLGRLKIGGRTGVQYGYRSLDWATGGAHRGQFIAVGARPGIGKTALGVCIAYHAAQAGHDVVFFSLEMEPAEIGERFVAVQGTVGLTAVRHGGVEVENAKLALSRLPVWILHVPRPTITDLRAALRRKRIPTSLVIVDYLQLVKPAERYESRHEAVELTARGLKWMATEFGVPVVGLAQLNRGLEEGGKARRPVLSDFREGAIENDADVVIFVHRPKYYERGSTQAELVLAKQRQGPTLGCPVHFDGRYAAFYDLMGEAETET